jgi:hypothetical protein
VCIERADAGPTDILVADRFRTADADLASFADAGLTVGIDEGGRLRDAYDCLIDILPGKRPAPKPNVACALGFLDLPQKRSNPVRALDRVLVQLRGRGPGTLGPAAVSALRSAGLPASSISYLRGALALPCPRAWRA